MAPRTHCFSLLVLLMCLKIKTGLKIESGPNQGIRANKSQGINSSMIYTTSIITNENTVPIHLKMALTT